jgi:2-succinyl-5-enolpyruvyl-6-hydroxy-3-cyclohexene-1-carboxylate synthase
VRATHAPVLWQDTALRLIRRPGGTLARHCAIAPLRLVARVLADCHLLQSHLSMLPVVVLFAHASHILFFLACPRPFLVAAAPRQIHPRLTFLKIQPMHLDFRNTNSLWCSVLAETLHRCGVAHAVVSPGSRSTPLVFALAHHPEIEAIPVLDERSASFFALGLAKQSKRPVALVCTSGTAAANFFPAIIEARESSVPLIVITADRPPEMRECGSGQTIDQQKLYGAHVDWYHELAVPEATPERLRYLRQTIAHACKRGAHHERGPMHINAPFRDPLPPVADKTAEKLRGIIDEQFFGFLSQDPNDAATDDNPRDMANRLVVREKKRGVIVAGPDSGDCHALAQESGWPILADALSDTRHRTDGKAVTVSAYDVILRNERLAGELAPELVVCIGGWPASKVLRAWIEKHDPEIFMTGRGGRNRDALHGRTKWFSRDAAGLTPLMSVNPEYRDAGYANAWRHAEISARAAIDKSLAAIAGADLFEPCATALLARHLPRETPLFVASSMPVRDTEYFWPANDRGTRFFHNRGANGIDGTLSTALGVAHASERPAVLLTGDLSLLHDTNGFLQSSKLRGSLTIVLINNNGGGIFGHLPVAQFDPPFEEYFATPQNIDFARLCATYSVEHTLIENWSQFTKLIPTLPAGGVRVLEIRTDRKRDPVRRQTLLVQAASAI